MRPVTKVREQLAEHRRAGVPFGAAWPQALEALPADERREWGAVLEDTRGAWRAAFEARPATRAERALHAAGWDPEREPADLPDPWERVCPTCGDRLAPSKRPSARFCSRVCQRAAHGRGERSAA